MLMFLFLMFLPVAFVAWVVSNLCGNTTSYSGNTTSYSSSYSNPNNNHDDRKHRHNSQGAAEAEVRRMQRHGYEGSERLQTYYNQERGGWYIGRSSY
ncbi:hypothetical protein T484DRAFT_1958041 [Baffinella frigidus]|nr:hypothetical protein T484DRAFT_1958041 [Cryptophyta sp. CCMP2293]